MSKQDEQERTRLVKRLAEAGVFSGKRPLDLDGAVAVLRQAGWRRADTRNLEATIIVQLATGLLASEKVGELERENARLVAERDSLRDALVEVAENGTKDNPCWCITRFDLGAKRDDLDHDPWCDKATAALATEPPGEPAGEYGDQPRIIPVAEDLPADEEI